MNNEEPKVNVCVQKITLSQAKKLLDWLNTNIEIPGFSYIIEGQVDPNREQIFSPTDPVEGEPLYPFYTKEPPEITEAIKEAYKNWTPKPVWPPQGGYDAEALYRQTFVSLDAMGEYEEDYENLLEE